MVKESYSEEETFSFAMDMGKKAHPGQVYTLTGDLGTGKTVFAQGFSKGLGVTEYVNSPTFTIIQEYDTGVFPVYHFDVYRIGDISEMEETGYEDYFYGDGVCLIEWAKLIEDIIPKDAVSITIDKDLTKGENYRCIKVKRSHEDFGS
ncbi:MAG: tRNA (adenosine(37)-N6)-threonylcarbamoyltransferase complex ATPase subunit type 1 TsaE [Lachnospiraceae bacterium]|nr:tRNA (adenosine(37)-N6)-threonylcarbamoyltransferase complex ATPase subunit type 1 TsaE [Lachnospiraceae bacterium]